MKSHIVKTIKIRLNSFKESLVSFDICTESPIHLFHLFILEGLRKKTGKTSQLKSPSLNTGKSY